MPLNEYFKKMLVAKQKKAQSFVYKGSKYIRKMHALKPGMTPVAIYKKA
jgi:hypothetical protein